MRTQFNFSQKALIWGLLTSVIFFVSCSIKDPRWETDLLAPLVKTKISIKHLSQDSTLVADSSGLVHLVYRNSLYNLAIDSFFEFSDTSLKNTFRIDSLALYNSKFEYPLSLGTLARAAGPAGQLLLFFHGFSQIIPEIQPIAGTPIQIKADTIFQTMTLESGTLDLSLYNGLPIDVTNVQYSLKNSKNNEEIVSGVFPLIAAGATEQRSIDLAGRTIEGQLTAQLISLSSPGSRGVPVLIDTNNQVLARLQVYNLRPYTATALWPAQNLINDSYYFGLEGLPVELKHSIIGAGKARIRLSSTLQDSVRFSYTLSTAKKNGIPFQKTVTLNPAPPGGVSQRTEEENLKGYDFDFSGENNDSFNLQFNHVLASIDSTGEIKTISKTDSIFVELAFENLHPDYARGYLNDTILGTGLAKENIDVFANLRSGKLEVSQAELSVEVANKIGVDLNMSVKQLEGINSSSGKKVVMDAVPLQKEVFIPRASDLLNGPPIQPAVTKLSINEGNSNIREFISNFPDEIIYNIELQANPKGNVSNWNDFIYDGELLNVDLLLDVPLNLSAEGLLLSDTLSLSIQGDDYDAVKEGTLHFFFENDFPVDAGIQIYLLDESDRVLDSLFLNNFVVGAGQVDVNGRVQQPRQTNKDVFVEREKIDKLLRFRKMYMKVIMDSLPLDREVKIFSDYELEMIVTADFVYEHGK